MTAAKKLEKLESEGRIILKSETNKLQEHIHTEIPKTNICNLRI